MDKERKSKEGKIGKGRDRESAFARALSSGGSHLYVGQVPQALHRI